MSTHSSNSGNNGGRKHRFFAPKGPSAPAAPRMYEAPALNMSLAGISSLVARQMDAIDSLELQLAEQGGVLRGLVEVVLKVSDTVTTDRAAISAISRDITQLANIALDSQRVLAEVRASQASKEWGQDWGYVPLSELAPDDSASAAGAVANGEDQPQLIELNEMESISEAVGHANNDERLADWLADTNNNDEMDVDI